METKHKMPVFFFRVMSTHTEDDAPILDELTEKMRQNIDLLCSDPPMSLSCPVCSQSFVVHQNNFEKLNTHFIEAHSVVITQLNDIPLIEECVNSIFVQLKSNQRVKTDFKSWPTKVCFRYLSSLKTHIDQLAFDQLLQLLPTEVINGVPVHVLSPKNEFDGKLRDSLRMKLLVCL